MNRKPAPVPLTKNERQAAADQAQRRGVIRLLTSPRTADVKAASNLLYLVSKGLIELPASTWAKMSKTLTARADFAEQSRELAMMRKCGATSFFKFA